MKIVPNIKQPKIGTKYKHYITLPYKNGDFVTKWTIVGEDFNGIMAVWKLVGIGNDNMKILSYDYKDEIEERLRSGLTVIIK